MSNPKQVFIRKYDGYTEASVGERLDWQKCPNHKLRIYCTEAAEVVDWAGHTCRDGAHQELEHDCIDGYSPPAELVERACDRAVIDPDQAVTVLLEQARWNSRQSNQWR